MYNREHRIYDYKKEQRIYYRCSSFHVSIENFQLPNFLIFITSTLVNLQKGNQDIKSLGINSHSRTSSLGRHLALSRACRPEGPTHKRTL